MIVEIRLRDSFYDNSLYVNYLVDMGIITLVNLDTREIHFAPHKVGNIVHPDDWERFIVSFREKRVSSQGQGWPGALE